MAKLKVYTLGNHGLVGSSVGDALGLPSHVRQAQVLLVASSKAEAVRMVENVHAAQSWEVPVPTLSSPEFRQATGNDVDALREAGLLDAPNVLVTPFTSRSGDRVVQVDGSGVRVIGTLERVDGAMRFVPAEDVATTQTTKE